MQQSSPSSPKAKPFKPNFEQEESFQNLTQFFNGWNENNLSEAISDPEKNKELQTLVNNFFITVCQTFKENKVNPKVFEFTELCLNQLEKSQQNENADQQSSSQSDYKKEQLNEKKLIEETSKKVTNRIASQIKIKTPISEVALVEKINERVQKYKDTLQEIIESFDLPQNTSPDSIVPVLRTKFEYANANSNSNLNNTNQNGSKSNVSKSSNTKPSLKQQLIDVTNELANVRHQLQKTEDEIENKDNQIKEMKDSIQQLKSKTQNTTLIQEMNNELVDNRVEYGRMKSENVALKKENLNVHKRCEALEQKLEKYKQQVIEDKEINTELIKKLSETKNQLKQHQKQMDETSQETIKQRDQQQSLQVVNFIDQLTKQYENQAEELSQESNFRKHIVDSFKKLNQVNQELEHQLEISESKVNDLTRRLEHAQTNDSSYTALNTSYQNGLTVNDRNVNIDNDDNNNNGNNNHNDNNDHNNNNNNYNDNNNHNDNNNGNNKHHKHHKNNANYVDDGFIQDIQKQIDSINDEESKTPILNILSETNQPVPERVSRSVNSLVNTINKNIENATVAEENKTRNELLLNTCGSVLVYLNNLIETGEITRWTMNNHSFDEARSLLSTQVATITRFIKENCKGVVEDKSMISAFLKFKDPNQLDQYLQDYISKYENQGQNNDNENNNDQAESELMVLLLQAVSAGIVLHSYALQAKGQVERQAQDIKAMKSQTDKQQKREKQTTRELKAAQDGAQRSDKAIRSVKSVLRKAVIESDENNCHPNLILEQLEKIDDVEDQNNKSNPNQNEYTNQQYTKDLQAKLKDLQTKVQEQNEQIQDLNNEAEKESSKKEEENSAHIKNLEEQVKKLQKKNEKLKGKNATYKQRLRSSDNNNNVTNTVEETTNYSTLQSSQNILGNQLEADLDAAKDENVHLKQENERLVGEKERLYQKIQEINDSSVEKLNKLKASLKKSKQRIEEDYEKKREEYRATIAQNEAIIADLENEVQAAKESESETKDVINILNNDLNDIKDKFNTLQAEYRIMRSRLVGKEEEIKREKATFDAQFRLKQFASQTEAQAQIDAYRYENETKTRDFLVSVCRLFNEYVDPSAKIDYESVLDMLDRVSKDTKANMESAKQAQKAVKELDTVRKQLGIKKSAKLSENIHDLQRQNRQLGDKLKTIENEAKKEKEKEKENDKDKSNSNKDDKVQNWPEWANSLYDQVLKEDGFSDAKSEKEVQRAIEEAVLTAAGNPRTSRYLDFLRAEKKLVLSGKSTKDAKVKNPKLSLSQLMATAITITRLMKMSGHKPSPIAISIEPDEEEQQIRRSGNPDKSNVKPLFKQFVRNQSAQENDEQKEKQQKNQ